MDNHVSQLVGWADLASPQNVCAQYANEGAKLNA